LSFFSVIIPSYNRALLIGETIQSVINQSFEDWELIIVDDGSTDNTKEVIRQFQLLDNRINYHYQNNAERSAARNQGIKLAKGEFICFLDSDDRWLDFHLDYLHENIILNKNKVAFYFTSMRWVFKDFSKDIIFDSPVNKNFIEYVIENQIGTPCQCFHNSILNKHQYNVELNINEDVELCTRIVAEYELIQLPKITVNVYIHGDNTKFHYEDYITPQVKAMKIIFSNPNLKDKISKSFQNKIQHSFDSQYIMVWERLKDKKKLNKAILRYLFRYPFDRKNKARIVLYLYNQPFGNFIEKTVKSLKSVIRK
jgi:glycosyltransferase involved in cell wall biosynthesis